MLLRLIPDLPHPNILFTLAFSNLPESVPFPQNWAQQLQHILHDQLDMPSCVHALDKAAWTVCLLHEVNFCVTSRTIQCYFVDGTRLELPLENQDCLDALQGVMNDVHESAIIGEIEQRRARALSAPAVVQPTPVMRVNRHKKTRSFFASFFASLVPASMSRPSSPTLPQYESEAAPIPPPEPSVSSRFLRKRARASLVDIYRQFVIPELGSPFPSGGYVFWVLQSALQQIEGRMQFLIQELGGEMELHRLRSTPSRIRLRLSPSALSESPFDDDSASSSSAAETVSDASSVHTPRDSIAEYPVLYRASSSDDALIRAENGLMPPPTVVSSPPSPSRFEEENAQAMQNDAVMQEYTTLHARNVRLRSLMSRVELAERTAECERVAQLEILEVKSKRRAWSVRALLGRASADQAGYATPQVGSPLARCVVTITETGVNDYCISASSSTRGRFAVVCEDVEPAELFSPSCDEYLTQGTIPFPAIDNDDFCSTGPQDPLPLFGHPFEADNEEECMNISSPTHIREIASASCSAVDLPGMLSTDIEFGVQSRYASPLAAQQMENPQSLIPIDVFGDAYTSEESNGEEFTLSLGSRDPYATRRGRGNASSKFMNSDWMMSSPVDCR